MAAGINTNVISKTVVSYLDERHFFKSVKGHNAVLDLQKDVEGHENIARIIFDYSDKELKRLGFSFFSTIVYDHVLKTSIDPSDLNKVIDEEFLLSAKVYKEREVVKAFFDSYIAGEIDDECSICSSRFTFPVILDCGHSFDLKCLDIWRKTSNTCPSDRSPINEVEIIYPKLAPARINIVAGDWGLDEGQYSQSFNVALHISVKRLKEIISERLRKPHPEFMYLGIAKRPEELQPPTKMEKAKYVHEYVQPNGSLAIFPLYNPPGANGIVRCLDCNPDLLSPPAAPACIH